jgi:hypothetical protein
MNWLGRDTVRAPHLLLCLSEKEYLRAAKHCGLEQPSSWLGAAAAGTCHTWEKGGKLICIVCIRPPGEGADPIQVACSLVHEAVHVFQELCQSIGEASPSSEFEAYSIERISEQLMREFLRRMEAS